MPARLLISLLLLALHADVFAAEDFSGAWVAWICPDGVQRDSGRCSNFVLELHQKGDRLCGAHFFATAGAERVDEGMAPSLIGEISSDTATVVTTSTRAAPPVKVRVEMKKVSGTLRWLRLQNPPGDYLLPQAARLHRSRSKTLFAPVFEQELKAACLSAFIMADEDAAKKAQPAADAPAGAPAPDAAQSAPPAKP